MYIPQKDIYFQQGLRQVLNMLGSKNQVQIVSGLSTYSFRSLDVIIRLLLDGQPVDDYGAWDLVSSHGDPCQRHIPRPEDWWQYMFRQSFGQRSNFADFYLKDLHQLSPLCTRYDREGQAVLDELFLACRKISKDCIDFSPACTSL